MKTVWIKKEELTLREWDSLCPIYELLFNGVNYSKSKYFRDEEGKIYEINYCTDGSLTERMELLRKTKNTKGIMHKLGF